MKDLLTIFNYPDNKIYNLMFHTWLRLASKYSSGFNIKVLSEREPNQYIKSLKNKYQFEWIVKKHYDGDLSNLPPHYRKKHNITFKMWNIYKNKNPFVFVDVDAFILKDINEIWKYSGDKPYIGINHQNVPKHTSNDKPFLNTGVLVVSYPKFIDYESIIKNFKGIYCKGFDQALIFSHFKNIGYDYTHPKVGFEWNSCAGYTELSLNNGEWTGKTKGLDINHDVYINHYWDEFKPWNLSCPILLETIKEST